MHNAGATIKRSIESVLEQSIKPFEVIIVDDGSNDLSYEKAKKLTSDFANFAVIKKKNGGVSSARNCGINRASGDYVMFMDSDDTLRRDAIKRIETIIKRGNCPDFIKFGYIAKGGLIRKKYNFALKQLGSVIKKNNFKKEIIPNLLSTNDFSAVWNIAVKTSIVKLLSFDEGKKYGEDRKFNADLIKSAETIYVDPSPLYEYRITNGSAMRTGDQEKALRQLKDVLETNGYIYNMFDCIEIDSLKKSAVSDLEHFIIGNTSKKNYVAYIEMLDELSKIINELRLEKEVKGLLKRTIKIERKYSRFRKNKLKSKAYQLKSEIRGILV
jgi:glycosyltransferase involved in cell wall biosynthesis